MEEEDVMVGIVLMTAEQLAGEDYQQPAHSARQDFSVWI